ncbi:hypothetical protein [Microbacterium sediminis]|uniref:hypothetical protein n=1 Tax=Microbacterium sediminis TaxID=904291 RepID=UPI001071C33A|nr:hypothetical protein [Microbacterium sediminis]QBR73258.1 hypothetical protein E3O41_01590 [Microbacterium sediminis]
MSDVPGTHEPMRGSEANAPTPAPENPLSLSSMARDARQELAEGLKNSVSDLIYTGLMYAGFILAILLPIAGIAVGGLFLLRAISSGRSKFLPLATIIASIVFWVATASPLGILPVLLGVL